MLQEPRTDPPIPKLAYQIQAASLQPGKRLQEQPVCYCYHVHSSQPVETMHNNKPSQTKQACNPSKGTSISQMFKACRYAPCCSPAAVARKQHDCVFCTIFQLNTRSNLQPKGGVDCLLHHLAAEGKKQSSIRRRCRLYLTVLVGKVSLHCLLTEDCFSSSAARWCRKHSHATL